MALEWILERTSGATFQHYILPVPRSHLNSMTVTSGLVTAAGYSSMLEEPDQSVQLASLQTLNNIVDEFWPEIADYISQIEALYEDKTFPDRELAALVASKVFFHLEEYNEAIRLALGASSKFNLNEKSEYTNTMTSKILDEYISQSANLDLTSIDSRLVEFAERLFSHSLKSGLLKSGLGIAIESNRMDWISKFIGAARGAELVEILAYCQHHVRTFITTKSTRSKVLEIMVQGYHSATGRNRDWSGAAQCLYLLGRADDVASLMDELLSGTTGESREWSELMALQLAFDVSDHDDQQFCGQVAEKLQSPATALVDNVKAVLRGSTQVGLNLEFLFRNNKTDLLLLETLRTSIDQRSSVLHNGVVVAHSLMQAGTTNDAFLRKNLEWLAKASHWAKFTATASMGVIQKGHLTESKTVLSAYLPTPGGAASSRSPYSEGGALYALGLIHANHHDDATEELLRTNLESAQGNEVLQVGACLGLGLTCLATKSQRVYDSLKNVLFLDSAVAGEAAGYAMGLVMAGSGNEAAVRDLLTYAHETQHEKIVRACSVGLALITFEQEQAADATIAQMIHDSDAIIRYGGMFAIGMAYCGTSQNSAVKQLLHFSVSDVSDDVRRAAVISLGLVLSNQPARLPKVLKLLSQSYNPHVRYGACIALGIGCPAMAASVPEALSLLEPLLNDVSEFVRQGALLGMGLVCQETSSKQVNGSSQKFREKIQKMVGDKHEDIMCRFGAVLAHGLIDIGGRNASVPLFTKSGSLRLGAAVGFCLFAQMWYWYPLMLTISLAVAPTALIALNKDLKMPKNFSVKSKTKPSTFAYPPEFKVETKEGKSRVTSAVLSAAKGRGKAEETTDEVNDVEMNEAKKKEEEAPEPAEEILNNPCRVVPAQETHIHFSSESEGARYEPVVPGRTSGYLVVRDLKPQEPEELLEFGNKAAEGVQSEPSEQPAGPTSTAPATATEEEAPPPEEFEWEG